MSPRAVTIVDSELRVVEVPELVPEKGEVIIAVAGAGLNAADLLQRRGFYPAPPGWPADIPGLECAGTVLRVGEGVDHELVGRKVACVVGGGGQAEQCRVPASHLLFLDDASDLVSAGGFAEAATTAFDALVLQAQLSEDERVLISGAAGGVGTAAIQIAAARGAHVIAVTRDPHQHEALQRLGAHECVSLDDVASLEPVDVILELVGAAHLSLAQRVIAPRGRIVVIGTGGGGRVEVDLLGIMVKRATLTGSTLRARSVEEKAAIAARMNAEIVPLLSAGDLRVPVAAEFDLDQATEAYEFFARPGKLGKVLLRTAGARNH